jgi:hypothetical protein
MIKELNNNNIGIDFMHLRKLTYDVQHTRQVKFANTFPYTICAKKQVTVAALTSRSANG